MKGKKSYSYFILYSTLKKFVAVNFIKCDSLTVNYKKIIEATHSCREEISTLH